MTLKRIILFSVLGVGLVLATLLGLGLRQYTLYISHKAIADQTETLLFRFTVIREQLVEELFRGDEIDLGGVAAALEQFNAALSSVLADRRIADEYKISFMQAVDLPGLVVLVRQLDARPAAADLRRNLSREMRILGERLLLFDRLVVEQAKRRLIGFQNILIGALAILLFGALVVLLIGYRRLVAPLVCLNDQGDEVLAGERREIACPTGGRWLLPLVGIINHLVRQCTFATERLRQQATLATVGRRVQEAVLQARTVEELGRDVCRALLENRDYCLAWLGGFDDQDGCTVLGVDGSTSMTDQESASCLSVLLAEAREQGREKDPARRVLAAGEPLIISDYLRDIPKGLLKETPLADGRAAYGVFPLGRGRAGVAGVLGVYSKAESGFTAFEVDQLQGLAAAVALALRRLGAGAEGGVEPAPLAPGLTEPGGVLMGVAHEVSDLANGMINYAQILADESHDQEPQREIAAKLIETGEQLAGIMKKTIFYSRGAEHNEEFLPLAEVLADAVVLGRHAFKNSGIQVEVDLPADLPPLPVNARRMQQLFLLIFDHARRALNLRYPGKESNKRFMIHGELRSQNQGRCLRLSFSDQLGALADAEALAPPPAGRRPAAATGLALLREIVERQGGVLQVDTIPGRGPAIILEFPC